MVSWCKLKNLCIQKIGESTLDDIDLFYVCHCEEERRSNLLYTGRTMHIAERSIAAKAVTLS